jgi:hypothetical protein
MHLKKYIISELKLIVGQLDLVLSAYAISPLFKLLHGINSNNECAPTLSVLFFVLSFESPSLLDALTNAAKTSLVNIAGFN